MTPELYPYDQFAFLLQDPENPDDTNNPYIGRMLYVYDGAVGNQYYLCPIITQRQTIICLSPGCKYSLVLKVAITEDTSDGTTLAGTAYGGSGVYDFNWAYWNLGTAWGSEGQNGQVCCRPRRRVTAESHAVGGCSATRLLHADVERDRQEYRLCTDICSRTFSHHPTRPRMARMVFSTSRNTVYYGNF